ncbi:hypothetical protein L332_02565 [Agrococcus pavilionensis RW1]|uniref:Uncharacterized protein n=1 Tax=Agrococcus pavilionensis RW1 TaxID=1330458 RepID=U1MRQ4_9MICO|nr:hypothetical protein L332_02565 [Agrococcus pavilionensis RW1]
MSDEDTGCPDLEPGELEAIQAEDRREERAVSGDAKG